MAAVRTHGLARQQQLLEPGSLVLGPGLGAVPGRREPLRVPIARSRSAALERASRKNVVFDGCTQRRYLRAGRRRVRVSRPVCGFVCVEISLPALPIQSERRVKVFPIVSVFCRIPRKPLLLNNYFKMIPETSTESETFRKCFTLIRMMVH